MKKHPSYIQSRPFPTRKIKNDPRQVIRAWGKSLALLALVVTFFYLGGK